MSSPSQAPFVRLVECFQSALRLTDAISIPAEILFTFTNATQPLEDTGLRDFVKLFDGSHSGNRLRLNSTVLAQLVQIVFRLQASLLQQRLIYSLLGPPQASALDSFRSWRKSILGKLVPTILRSLHERSLSNALLIATVNSLALFMDGDEEANMTVYNGQDTLRRALGAIVSKHDSYPLRIAVANLIRVFMKGRFDRHLFWPHDTPPPSFNEFPLANLGDAEWLADIVQFLSAANTSQAFRTDLPDVYLVQYSEFKQAVAIISDDITLVLPGTSQYPLRFLQLPLIDGMVCQATDGQDHDITIKYRRATGYQISDGVKRAVDDIHLVLGDQAQSVAFAQSVQSRVAKRLEDISPMLEPKQSTRRTSYASIDLSQSRETSAESEEETNSFEHIPEWAVSINMPSHVGTQGAANIQLREERTAETSHNSSASLIDSLPKLPAANISSKIPPKIQRTRGEEVGIGSTEQKSATPSSSADGVASDSMKRVQHRLKRPSSKGAGDANQTDIDWDEDLRDDDVEPEGLAANKVKAMSKKAAKSKNITTGRISQSKSKKGYTQEKTSKSQAMASRRTTRTTRARRTAAIKSAKYVEESESDLNHEGDVQPSSVVQESNSLMGKNTLSKKDKMHVDDSQGQQDGEGLNSDELDSIKDLPAEGSSSAAPRSAAKGEKTMQDETANDSLPIDAMAKEEALARNDTSFGTKIAQILTTKAHLPVVAIERQARKSFGDAKTFIETVNATRNTSLEKSAIKESLNIQPDNHKTALHQLPSIDQSLADSTAQYSPAQAQVARPCGDRPETRNTHRSPADEVPKSNFVRMIYKDAGARNIPQKAVERTAPISIPNDDLDESVLPKIPKNDFDMAALAVTQVTYQEGVFTAITKTGNTIEKTLVHNSSIRDESPERQLSKPAIMASNCSPSKRESPKLLPKNPPAAEAQKAMKPPPLSCRSDCGNIPSPTDFTDDEGDKSLLMTNEKTQRKTPIVSFGAQGPRNQGVVSPSKQPKVAEAYIRLPSETGKHAAAISQKIVPSEHVLSPALMVTSDEASFRYSQAICKEEGILGQPETVAESLAISQGSDLTDKDEDGLAQEESAVEVNVGAVVASRRNASQSSKVDENGSPRLHNPRKALISSANLLVTSTTTEQSKRSGFAPNELQHSVYTESNSCSSVIASPEHRPQRAKECPKPKMIQIRTSIGLQAVLSQNFPESSKSLNTAAFKKHSKSTLSKPPVTLEKVSPGVQKVCNVQQTKQAIHPKAVHAEIDYASLSFSPQHLLSDSNTRVTRLGPKTPSDALKVVEETNPAPISFKTSFRNMLMRPPPLPSPRQGQSDLRAGPAGKGKTKTGLTTQEEDLTLIDEVDIVEHRPVRQVIRPQHQQPPDSSTDSQSSPIPKPTHVSSRKQDPGSLAPEVRLTQQHILNVLSRAATGLLFRLQAAEQAIQGKTHEYHIGCYTLIDKLETAYEACIQHERSIAAPRVVGLRERYNAAIENCSKGIVRVRRGAELRSLSKNIEKRRDNLLSLIESRMESESPEQKSEG